jgi:hypothetical protein
MRAPQRRQISLVFSWSSIPEGLAVFVQGISSRKPIACQPSDARFRSRRSCIQVDKQNPPDRLEGGSVAYWYTDRGPPSIFRSPPIVLHGPVARHFLTIQSPASLIGSGVLSVRGLGSLYRSGRSPDWLKFKNPDAPAVKREAEEDWR